MFLCVYGYGCYNAISAILRGMGDSKRPLYFVAIAAAVYANRSYNALFDTKGEWFIEDARKADPSTMPDFQLLCGGFPCQTYPE